jgi:hypothetical protein
MHCTTHALWILAGRTYAASAPRAGLGPCKVPERGVGRLNQDSNQDGGQRFKSESTLNPLGGNVSNKHFNNTYYQKACLLFAGIMIFWSKLLLLLLDMI